MLIRFDILTSENVYQTTHVVSNNAKCLGSKTIKYAYNKISIASQEQYSTYWSDIIRKPYNESYIPCKFSITSQEQYIKYRIHIIRTL